MANDTGQRNRTATLPGSEAVRRPVERAVGELRRGAAVLLRDDGDGPAAAVVAAAEIADLAAPAFAAAATAPACVVAAGRALALSLDPRGSRNVAVRAAEDGGLMPEPGFVRAVAGAAGDGPLAGRLTAIAADRLQDAAVELVRLARLLPAAVVARVAGDADALTAAHGLLSVRAADIAGYRALMSDGALTLAARAAVPLEGAEQAEILAFRPADGGKEHLAIRIGDPGPGAPVLARIHSECFTGDLLGSLRCDCGEQLRGAIRAIGEGGGGLLLYLAQEGRGIGLVNKLRAYRLQDGGCDTIEANERLGFDADERVYRPAAAMLREMGFARVRLLTNNPAKVAGLAACGIEVVERVPHAFPANGHNDRYLHTKAARAGHLL